VRYFYQSSKLRNLKLDIEADAESKRKEKKEELQRLNRAYAGLQRREESLSHEYGVNSRGWEYHMKKRCEKCRLEREMRSMMITVHEWPLPARKEEAIVVVFDLACPIAFDMWRSVTCHILVDICTPKNASPSRPYTTLPKYNALQGYRECHPR
jgi:hypothetical protein